MDGIAAEDVGPSRSSATVRVGRFTNSRPLSITIGRLQASTVHGRISQCEAIPSGTRAKHEEQGLLNQRTQGDLLPCRTATHG